MAEEIKDEDELVLDTSDDIYSDETETPKSEKNDSEDSSVITEVAEATDHTQSTIQKKMPLVNKILFGVVGFLVLTLIAGLIMFLMGFFDPEEPVMTEEEAKKEVVIEDENKFSLKDINSKNLNKKLLLLTNKNRKQEEANEQREKEEEEKKILALEKKKKDEALALEEKKIQEQKEFLESKKQELEKEKQQLALLREEATLLKEQLEMNRKLLEESKQLEQVVEIKNIEVPAIEEEPEITQEIVQIKKEPTFLSLINVATIKGQLYKSYLDKITDINTNIKLCRDNMNRIEIYIGPFNDDTMRAVTYKKLVANNFNESYEVELTKEEYKKRCEY